MVNGKPVICVSSTSDLFAYKKDPTKVLLPGKLQITSPSSYPRAIQMAGGVPLLTSSCCPEELSCLCDGLVLTGGADIDPALYGEQVLNDTVSTDRDRDDFELSLFRYFYDADKPILAICRGFQLVNVALGGNLWQDLVEQKGLVHMDPELRHPVTAIDGSLLNRLFGEHFNVNSTHHQAVKDLGEGLHPTAWSPAGICEAYEHDTKPIIGTQFHPERLTNVLWDDRTPDFAPLFTHFVNMCRK